MVFRSLSAVVWHAHAKICFHLLRKWECQFPHKHGFTSYRLLRLKRPCYGKTLVTAVVIQGGTKAWVSQAASRGAKLKGRYDVTGIVENMALVNSGF